MPQIHALPDGRLLITATRFACNDVQLFDLESEALQQPQMLLYFSEDLGIHYSKPQILPIELPPDRYTVNGAGMLLQPRHDRWMYPFETWKLEGYCGPPDQKAGALFSSNDGQTWDELSIVADDHSGRLCYWDQMCTQLADRRIYTML